MELIDLTCSRCGAQLKVNRDLKKCMCQYCGNEIHLSKDKKVEKKQSTGGVQIMFSGLTDDKYIKIYVIYIIIVLISSVPLIKIILDIFSSI